MEKYDILIVGCGLYGATIANLAIEKGYKVLMIDKRKHLGGNIYTEKTDGIMVHKYGPHIFHTDEKWVWDYVNRFSKFYNYINTPLANYKGQLYNLPFNMNTFHQIFGVNTPQEAMDKIEETKYKGEIHNLEEQALSMVGDAIYYKLVKEYTEKQWGSDCANLSSDIIKRLPVRFTYDNNYFNDEYQGIPSDGYTQMIKRMVKGADIQLEVDDYVYNKEEWNSKAKVVVYTGKIDEYFYYRFGNLDYRSLCFVEKIVDVPNYQGNAVINFTSHDVPYTRIIEHKHFQKNCKNEESTILTYEYSDFYDIDKEAYYPLSDDKNIELYVKYKELADAEDNLFIGGRLGCYKYYDMDDTIISAKMMFEEINNVINKK